MPTGKQAENTLASSEVEVPTIFYIGAFFIGIASILLSIGYASVHFWTSAIWAALFLLAGGILSSKGSSFISRFLYVAGEILSLWTLIFVHFLDLNMNAPIAILLLAFGYLAVGFIVKRESNIYISCALFSASYLILLPLIVQTKFIPLLAVLPVIIFYSLNLLFSKKETWFDKKLFAVSGHWFAVFSALSILIVRHPELWLLLAVCAAYPLMYLLALLVSRQMEYLAGLIFFSTISCYLILVQIFDSSTGNALFIIAVTTGTFLIFSRLVLKTKHSRAMEMIYWATTIILIILGATGLASGELAPARGVLVACAIIYIILLAFTKSNSFLYLVTLNLGLLGYSFIKTSETHFTQELFIYFLYCLFLVGFYFIYPYFKRAAAKRRSLLFLTITDWKGALFFALPIGGIILLFLLFFSTRIAEHPQFCRTCHYMDPYVDSWETSSHKDVNCLLCHYEPGIKGQLQGKIDGVLQVVKYASGAYSLKPHAEIPDAACLREGCHSNMDTSKEVIYKKNIKFNHAHHLEEKLRNKKLRCTSCHSQIVQGEGEHLSVTETVCFLCHFKGRDESGVAVGNCRSCHGEPENPVNYKGVEFNHKEFLSGKEVPCIHCHTGVTEGSGEVPRERCITCHVEHSEEFSDSQSMHRYHVTDKKEECFECHLNIEHGSKDITQQLSPNCGSCHGTRHNIAEEMYMGTGAIGVKSSPDIMFLADVRCEGCHKYDEVVTVGKHTFKTMKAKPESCNACHDKDYAEMLKDWQEEIKEGLEKLTIKLGELEVLLKDKKVDTRKQADPIIARAKANLAFIRTDASFGAHNYFYSQSILEAVESDLEAIRKIVNEDNK